MNQQGPRKSFLIENAFYDEAKHAIVMNGEIEGKKVQIPWYEKQFNFHPEMDRVYEMKKTAEMMRGKTILVEFAGEDS